MYTYTQNTWTRKDKYNLSFDEWRWFKVIWYSMPFVSRCAQTFEFFSPEFGEGACSFFGTLGDEKVAWEESESEGQTRDKMRETRSEREKSPQPGNRKRKEQQHQPEKEKAKAEG